jgi:stage V sporulation protein B
VSKAAEMAKVSAKGGFHLFWGLAASTIILAVGVVLVARLLSPSEYGLYTIALTAPTLIMIFRDWGVNTAMIKYVAQYNSENKPSNVKSILIAGLIFELALGLSLSLISFLLSGFLATNIFQRPDMKPLIEIASFTILAGALLTAAQSAFIGVERVELNSITMIGQSTLKIVLVFILIIVGLGPFGAILGNTIAFLIIGLASVLMIYVALYKKLHKLNDEKLEIAKNIKTMFKYGLPLSISAIIGGFLAQFYNFLIAIYSTDLLIGNYAVATNFAVLITFFASPIATILFPAFSKLDPQKEKETLRNVFQFSIKYAALLVVPAATAIIALSEPAIFTLFGEKYTAAPIFLALLAVTYLFTAFGNLSLGNLINSQGKTQVNLLLALVAAATGFPLSLLLIPRFGIIGLIITTITAGIPSLIIALYWVKKHYSITVDWISSTKILLTSTTAAAITYTILSQLSFNSWIKLVIGITIFLSTFLISIIITKTINKQDIDNIREMLSELGPLSHLLNILLNIVEKLMTILQF